MFLKPFGFIGQGDALAVNPAITSATYTAGSAGTPASIAVVGSYAGADTLTLYGVTGDNPITVSKAQLKAGSGGTNTLGFFSISSFDFADGSFDVTGLDAADEGDYIAFYIEEDNNGGSSDIEQVAATPQDFTAPTFSSANVNTAGDTLQVVFDSAVYGTSIPAAFTLSGVSAGTPTLGTITGFGTTTLSIPLSVNLPANGDTLTLAYASATGDLVDVAGNALASFTGQSVTNNVPSGAFTDDFNRADEDLSASANWTTYFIEDPTKVNVEVVSNQLLCSRPGSPTQPGRTTCVLCNEALAGNHYAEAEFVSETGGGQLLIFVRHQGTGTNQGDTYNAAIKPASIEIQRQGSAGSGVLVSKFRDTIAGDVFRMEANGTTLNLYVNGVLELTTTDANYSGGSTGIGAFNGDQGDNVTADNWECGNV